MSCKCGCQSKRAVAAKHISKRNARFCKVRNFGIRFRSNNGNIVTFQVDFKSSCGQCTSSTPVTWTIPKVSKGKVRIINTSPNGIVTVQVFTPVTDFTLCAKVKGRCLKTIIDQKCVFKVVSSCSITKCIRIVIGKRIE